MPRKLKQTNTGLLLKIPPEVNTIDSNEINKKYFKNVESQKLVMNKSQLNNLLSKFTDEYIIVGSNKDYLQQFSMLYFDTPELKMYFEHHNKLANRFQVSRKYKYNTGKSHLIIKHTDNKHVNHVKKVKTKYFNDRIPLKYFDYINKHINHPAFQLNPVLSCEFNRYSFTGSSMEWLVSIDSELVFWNEQRTNYLPNLAVVTIKTKNSSPKREITNALKLAQAFPSGLNKFSVGMAITNPGLKQNLLKQKIHNIKRISNGN